MYRLASEIGFKLRQLRQQRGLGVRDLARRIKRTPSWISRMENGLLNPNKAFILAAAPALHLNRNQTQQLLALLDLFEAEHQAVPSEKLALAKQQRAIARLFRNAQTIRSFNAMIVPGMLQTAGYARCVFRKGVPDVPWQLALRARAKWQRHLRDPSKQFTFLIYENALRFRICGPDILEEQIDRLRILPKHIRLRLIPQNVELPVVPASDFTVLDEALVVIDTAVGTITLRNPEHVREYIKQIQALEMASVPVNRLSLKSTRIRREQ